MFVPNYSPKYFVGIRVDPFKVARFIAHLLYSYHFIRLILNYPLLCLDHRRPGGRRCLILELVPCLARHFACLNEMEEESH